MSTISASTTSTTAFKITTDTTGALVFQTGASPTTAMTLGSDQSVTFAGTPTYSGGTANGVAYLNGSKVLTTGTALVFDGSNLGVGVTPSAWSGINAVQFNNGSLSWSTNRNYINSNAYWNGANWVRTTTGAANQFITSWYDNSFTWNYAGSGASGATVSWTAGMTLDASGQLSIGATSASDLLNLNGTSRNVRVNFLQPGQTQWAIGLNSGTTGLHFVGGSGNTEKMVLDDSGNLGIGTTSPSEKLQVAGSIRVTSNAANFNVLGGQLDFITDTTRVSAYNSTGSTVAFYTNSNGGTVGERARITSSGELLVGTTTTATEANIVLGAKTTVEGGQLVLQKGTSQTYATHIDNYTNSMRIMSGTDTSSSSVQLALAHSTGYLSVGGVYNATVGATNRAVYVDNNGLIGYSASVRASKTNIQSLSDVSWLLRLNTVSFNRREKDEQGNYTEVAAAEVEYGLIAEEAKEVNDALCFYDEVNGVQELRGVHYDKLTAPMLKMLQELHAKVVALENK